MSKKAPSVVNIQPGQNASPGVQGIQTIARGEPISNQTIFQTLDTAKQAVQTSPNTMNPQGQVIARDTANVIDTTKHLLAEKNPDEKFQQFAVHTGVHTKNLASTASSNLGPNIGVVGGSSQILTDAQRLAWLIVQNSEFRSVLTESITLMQKIFKKDLNRISQGGSIPFGEQTSLSRGLVGSTGGVSTGLPSTGLSSSTGLSTGMTQTNQPFRSSQYVVSDYPGSMFPSVLPSNIGIPSSTTTLDRSLNTGMGNLSLGNTGFVDEETRILAQDLRHILLAVANNTDFHKNLDTIFNLLHQLSQTTQQVDTQGLKQVWWEAKEIIERFTPGKTLDNLIQAVNALISTIRDDTVARTFFYDARRYFNDVVNNPLSLNNDVKVKEMERLIATGRSLMTHPKFAQYMNFIMDELRDILNSIKHDDTRIAWTNSITKFVQDLAIDPSVGRPSLSTLQTSLQQMKGILIPIILKEFETIPIARAEVINPKYDFVLENLVFSSSDFLPEHIKIKMDSDFDMNLRGNAESDVLKSKIKLKISNIQTNLRNVGFSYRRKVMPRLEDKGVADIKLGGPGNSIKLVWEVRVSPDKGLKLTLRRATCHLDTLSVKIIQAHHNILDKMMTKMFAGSMRKRMEKEVETNLETIGVKIASVFNNAFKNIGGRSSGSGIGTTGMGMTKQMFSSSTPTTTNTNTMSSF